MSRRRYVQDWRLPPGWRAQRDTSIFGDGGAPLFADPWDVLEPPGGEVSVAVLDPTAVPTSSPDAARTVATGDRRPPTLLLERRGLSRTTGKARRRLQSPPPAAPGEVVRPGHRTVSTPHGTVALLSTRPWDAATGPDVRVVAVVIPKWSRDAVVLTLTWDDDSGMAGLERLAEELVRDLEIVVEDPVDAPERPGRDGRLTALVVRAFGARTFGRAAAAAWLALGVVLAALALTGGWFRTLLLLLGVLVAVALPVMLAWRSWTAAHAALTDGRSSPLPDGGQGAGLLHYLVAAALLGAIALGPTVGSGAAPWYLTAAAWADVVAHALLLVLEAGRGPAPRVRARWEARRAGARPGGPPGGMMGR